MYIRGCVRNKRNCQKEIYKAFYGYALEICNGYASSAEVSMELVNEGFLKIFKQVINHRPVHINDISSFTGWLQKVMLSTAIDHYENENKHYIISVG
jgi:RNA polymerase sigma-70 factor (ECF subfamily)